jgi:hypothetical protein
MPKRVYLADEELRKRSAHHTAYVGAPADEHIPGLPSPLHKLEFFGGVARDVDETTYQRFADVGVVTQTRPKRPADDED